MDRYELEDLYYAYRDAANDVFEAMGNVEEALEKLAFVGDDCKGLREMKARLGEMSTKLERIVDDMGIEISNLESLQEGEESEGNE